MEREMVVRLMPAREMRSHRESSISWLTSWRERYLHVHVSLCTVSVHTRSLLLEGELITFLSLLLLFFSSH